MTGFIEDEDGIQFIHDDDEDREWEDDSLPPDDPNALPEEEPDEKFYP